MVHSIRGRNRKEHMELLTLKEVSQMLGSKDPKGRYVRNLRSKGILRCAKIGRNLMFDKRSVDQFIENQFAIQNKKMRASHRTPSETSSIPLEL